MIKLEVKQTEEAKKRGIALPSYTQEGDAGIDLRSSQDLTIKPGERATVKTGIKVSIPPGFLGLIKDRSGLASGKGIHTLAGIIDANYRGEIRVVLLNTGKEDFRIQGNERIAQLLIIPVAKVDLKEVEELSKTERNEAGWGSTGVT
jgi:dUTP pyrophosphatase